MVTKKFKVSLLNDAEIGGWPCVLDNGFTGGGECLFKSVDFVLNFYICSIGLPFGFDIQFLIVYINVAVVNIFISTKYILQSNISS